jgi:hypothetical protein
MGWEAGILNGGGKPKGMHWKTYQRLKSRHDALARLRCRSALVLGITTRLMQSLDAFESMAVV